MPRVRPCDYNPFFCWYREVDCQRNCTVSGMVYFQAAAYRTRPTQMLREPSNLMSSCIPFSRDMGCHHRLQCAEGFQCMSGRCSRSQFWVLYCSTSKEFGWRPWLLLPVLLRWRYRAHVPWSSLWIEGSRSPLLRPQGEWGTVRLWSDVYAFLHVSEPDLGKVYSCLTPIRGQNPSVRGGRLQEHWRYLWGSSHTEMEG